MKQPASATTYRMARRIREVNGSRIGVLFNGRENAELLGVEAARFYSERHQCMLGGTAQNSRSTLPVADADIRGLIDSSDFLILTVGDDETSAARLIEDAVLCEQLGKPVLAVITKPFSALADETANRFGLLNYPFIPVNHPIAGCDLVALTERALHVYRQGMATVTGIYRMTV